MQYLESLVLGLCQRSTGTQEYFALLRQIRSFELASELTLLYMQRTGVARGAGPVLETVLQRVPILHIRAMRLHSAIDRYVAARSPRSAVRTPDACCAPAGTAAC